MIKRNPLFFKLLHPFFFSLPIFRILKILMESRNKKQSVRKERAKAAGMGEKEDKGDRRAEKKRVWIGLKGLQPPAPYPTLFILRCLREKGHLKKKIFFFFSPSCCTHSLSFPPLPLQSSCTRAHNNNKKKKPSLSLPFHPSYPSMKTKEIRIFFPYPIVH